MKEELAQSLFDHIPVGVGSKGVIPTTAADLDSALEVGRRDTLAVPVAGSGATAHPLLVLLLVEPSNCFHQLFSYH